MSSLPIDLRRVRSLSDFQRKPKQTLIDLRENAAPIVLTVNGKPELVIQSAEAFQAMQDQLDQAQLLRDLLAAAADSEEGRTFTLAAAFGRARQTSGL